ncbi:MAG: aspartate aminotransferase [Paracoccaceae bacterium]|jgi:aspartate aminotransferase
MLTALKPQAADKILALIQMFKSDPRADKIDLGVGVYKDATGLTPVMRAIKAAERQLIATETTKTYTSLAGDPDFHAAMIGLVLGDGAPKERISAIATPGGTGALRQAFELIKLAVPHTKIWISNPTWPNHPSIIGFLGIEMGEYRYFNSATGGVDFAGMIADLSQVKTGDVVLLHGCCHNPTGANLTLEQWAQVVQTLNSRQAIPLVDLAYQGFGDGLEADAAATRLIAKNCPEVLIAVSCSKNFAIYRERTGILMALGNVGLQSVVQGNLAFLNRQNFSFPPDHGARLVTMILTDTVLRHSWQSELEEVRNTMLGLRQQLAKALRTSTNSDRFDFIGTHRGMFSRLGISPAMVEKLRVENGIYIVGDSRLNIAGLNSKTVPILAEAVASALRG